MWFARSARDCRHCHLSAHHVPETRYWPSPLSRFSDDRVLGCPLHLSGRNLASLPPPHDELYPCPPRHRSTKAPSGAPGGPTDPVLQAPSSVVTLVSTGTAISLVFPLHLNFLKTLHLINWRLRKLCFFPTCLLSPGRQVTPRTCVAVPCSRHWGASSFPVQESHSLLTRVVNSAVTFPVAFPWLTVFSAHPSLVCFIPIRGACGLSG